MPVDKLVDNTKAARKTRKQDKHPRWGETEFYFAVTYIQQGSERFSLMDIEEIRKTLESWRNGEGAKYEVGVRAGKHKGVSLAQAEKVVRISGIVLPQSVVEVEKSALSLTTELTEAMLELFKYISGLVAKDVPYDVKPVIKTKAYATILRVKEDLANLQVVTEKQARRANHLKAARDAKAAKRDAARLARDKAAKDQLSLLPNENEKGSS